MVERDREAIVAGFVATGMDSTRARLVVDVGIKAAEEAIATMVGKTELVVDVPGRIAAQSVAVQLVMEDCKVRFALMRAACEHGGAASVAVPLGGER